MSKIKKGSPSDHKKRQKELLNQNLFGGFTKSGRKLIDLSDVGSDFEDDEGENMSKVMIKSKHQRQQQQPPKKNQAISEVAEGHENDEGEENRTWAQEESSEEDEDAPESMPVLGKDGKWKVPKSKASSSKPKSTDKFSVEKERESEDEGEEKETEEESNNYDMTEEEAKRNFGELAISITEDPNENLSGLKELISYCGAKDTSSKVANKPSPKQLSPETRRLALLCTVAVFKDILPGYYIRAEKDMQDEVVDVKNSSKKPKVTLSKEVLKERTFDMSILNSYRRFLDTLKSILQPYLIHTSRKLTAPKKLIIETAYTCLYEMMSFSSHFNYFEEVLKLAASALQMVQIPGEMRRSVMAFRALFEEDTQGQITLWALRLISDLCTSCQYDCPPIWLKAIETVKLHGDFTPRSTKNLLPPGHQLKKGQAHMSGKQRKEWKAKHEQLQKMAAMEEAASVEDRTAWNRENIKHLFRIYFGVLKFAPKASLLPPVLAGLSRHAHKISVEYFVDLLQSLRGFLQNTANNNNSNSNSMLLDEKPLGVAPLLYCILTVDRIYARHENLAAMDLKFIYNSFFTQLKRIPNVFSQANKGAEGGESWEDINKPLMNCIEALFHPKRIIPHVRLAAFCQRIGDVIYACLVLHQKGKQQEIQLEIANAITCLMTCLKQILSTHQRPGSHRGSILDREVFGQGNYLDSCDDPDLCNPFSRSLLVFLENKVKPLLTVKDLQSLRAARSALEEILKMEGQ